MVGLVLRLGVHVLFGALLVVVAGSLAGEWLSIHNKLSDANAFLWGHQGYESVDLGRGWQILLFAGLLIRLFLVVRAIRPALQTQGEQYGAGLTWGHHTHLSIVEYWRWWVVHRRAALGHHFSRRRHHRHLPSLVFLRNSHRGSGMGRWARDFPDS